MPATKAKKKKSAARKPSKPAKKNKPLAAPTWQLKDLYAGVADPAIQRDLDSVIRDSATFNKNYAGKLLQPGGMSADDLLAALTQYEALVETTSKAASFAQLLHESDTADERHGALLADVFQKATHIRASLMFFELEWMDVPQDVADRLLADPKLARFRHYLWVALRFRPHKLTEPQEQVVNQLANTGSRAWQRFFDEFTSAQKFTVTLGGKKVELPQSQTLAILHEPDRKRRIAAAAAITEGLRKNERVLAYVFNTLLWDHQIEDELRKFPAPMAGRNLDNLIDEKTVAALIGAVEAGFPTVQRYYRLKARLLKIKRLADYDRYAPIADDSPAISWPDARARVSDSFNAFAPELAKITTEFFEKNWIDALVRPNKSGGAFSAATVPSVHPYILMNFTGKMRDVMTLAHELGHGVHQYLSRTQGLLQASTPLTLAETASVFAEMLVFERLMAEQTSPRVKLSLLCHKIEDTFATVFRQISMTRFEQQVHTARREKGELAVEDINRFWMESNRAMFGNSLDLTDGYGWWWSYIPHFVNSPFYCYAYAFGELLVIALLGLYREQGPSFVPKYIKLLTAGGSGTPDELLAPLGIDTRDPGFWKKGIAFIDDLVTQAEKLAKSQ